MVVVEAVELDFGCTGSDGEVPCYLSVVYYEICALGADALDFEARVGDEIHIGIVRPVGIGRKDEIEVLSVNFPAPFGGLGFHRVEVVVAVVGVVAAVRFAADAGVHVNGSCRTRVELIYVAFEHEGHAVVIYAPVLLVVRICGPPLGTAGAAWTAAHVACNAVVYPPFLLTSTGEHRVVLVEVHYGVVDVEGLLYEVRGHAVAVHEVHPHRIVTGGREDFLKAVLGRVLGPVSGLVLEKPYRDEPLGSRREGKGHLVDLLVNADHRLYLRGAWNAGL